MNFGTYHRSDGKGEGGGGGGGEGGTVGGCAAIAIVGKLNYSTKRN